MLGIIFGQRLARFFIRFLEFCSFFMAKLFELNNCWHKSLRCDCLVSQKWQIQSFKINKKFRFSVVEWNQTFTKKQELNWFSLELAGFWCKLPLSSKSFEKFRPKVNTVEVLAFLLNFGSHLPKKS